MFGSPDNNITILSIPGALPPCGGAPKFKALSMPEKLSSASIVCLPSYREGLPKVLLEAAAVGRPLIATDVPGCREIVKNGENGILVKLKNIDSLYNAIKLLVLNKEMRQLMGECSRKLVESELSTDIINTQILDFYKKNTKQ